MTATLAERRRNGTNYQSVEDWARAAGEVVRAGGGDATALLRSVDYDACGDDACLLIAQMRR
jgi:hypothetical protein